MTNSESIMFTKNDSASNMSHQHVKVHDWYMATQGIDKDDATADIIENEGHISSNNAENLNPITEHKTSPSASYFMEYQQANGAGSASSRK